jgi:hypothetical protein
MCCLLTVSPCATSSNLSIPVFVAAVTLGRKGVVVVVTRSPSPQWLARLQRLGQVVAGEVMSGEVTSPWGLGPLVGNPPPQPQTLPAGTETESEGLPWTETTGLPWTESGSVTGPVTLTEEGTWAWVEIWTGTEAEVENWTWTRTRTGTGTSGVATGPPLLPRTAPGPQGHPTPMHPPWTWLAPPLPAHPLPPWGSTTG